MGKEKLENTQRKETIGNRFRGDFRFYFSLQAGFFHFNYSLLRSLHRYMLPGIKPDSQRFLLPRRPHTLKDACFPHSIELFDRVVLFVEVSVGLFPGLCHCVLKEEGNKPIQTQRVNRNVCVCFSGNENQSSGMDQG